MSPLDQEIARRAALGNRPMTVAAMGAAFARLGYALDRDLDCYCTTRIMAGASEGATYPTITTGVKECDTGLSAFNVNARRDANFSAMQTLRGEAFAVTRGRILEA